MELPIQITDILLGLRIICWSKPQEGVRRGTGPGSFLCLEESPEASLRSL